MAGPLEPTPAPGSTLALQGVLDRLDKSEFSMRAIEDAFDDEESCSRFLLALRTRMLADCPDTLRQHEWRPLTLWQYECRGCRCRTSAKANCLFANTRVPIRYWLTGLALSLFNATGISAQFLARYLGIEPASAFRMLTALRHQLITLADDRPFGGANRIVEIDETFITQTRGQLGRDPVVFGIREEDRVWSLLVPDRSRATLYPLITRMVRRGSRIHTDQWAAYQGLDRLGYDHYWVNHSLGIFGSRGVSTAGIDAYWRQLKRTLRATYHAVSVRALPAYLKETEIRFNSHHDARALFDRFLLSIPQVRLF